MTQRIRYRKQADGSFRTMDNYPHPSNGANFYIVLNETEKSFKVFDQMAGDVMVANGVHVNMEIVKKKAKQALIALGIQFADPEKRNRV